MTKIALVQLKADINKYKNLKKITDYIAKIVNNVEDERAEEKIRDKKSRT